MKLNNVAKILRMLIMTFTGFRGKEQHITDLFRIGLENKNLLYLVTHFRTIKRLKIHEEFVKNW